MLRLILALAMMLAVQPARAWGDEGHRLIGRVAAQLVTPEVLRKAQAILDTDTSGLTRDTSFAEEANWADRYRESDRRTTRERYEATGSWHFIDIEIAAPDIDAACFHFPRLARGVNASQGVARDCITNKIAQFEDELRARSSTDAERLRALQFLLHLLGDLHQPLHAGEDHDRGGNDKWIVSPAPRRADLHFYWDTWLVRQLGDADASTAQVLALATGPQRRAWQRGSLRDWTMESFRTSRDAVYAPLPKPGDDGDYRLDEAYIARATDVVRTQLARAAVRLALVLQKSLGDTKAGRRR
jgi:hypothetical protein